MKRKMRLEFYSSVIYRRIDRELYKTKCIEYRWRLTASNGKIVLASTEGYATKAGAQRNWLTIANVIAHGAWIEVVE